MDTKEWALIIFTILAQMSVGSFLVLGALHYLARRAKGEEWADRLSNYALVAIGPVLVLAILASLLHLGNMINAPRAITNIGSSWLSREILFVLIFAVLGGAFAIMQWRKIASFSVRNIVAILAAVAGAGLVYTMARVYMIPNQPAWNSLATPISFFSTTVLLGLFAVGAAFVVTFATARKQDPGCEEELCTLMRSSLRWIAVVAVVVLGVQLLATSLYLTTLSAGSVAMQETARVTISNYGLLLALRVALVFAGAGILGFFIFQAASAPGRERTLGNLALSAFVLVLVAEVVGRYLFYATHVALGL
ncbi:MAG: dimethyl sulfoxide reductase anchor subunit [Chloroflexi bacterium]|jgi:anaerobic dimethyl sulfoxide reductase subunit C (anchor subunit)|nr:dimethyl sulfoxide reductase anchor subunit [Chloroflexota bacterium]